ncbi:C40 family peptidase [Actinoplanes couchii]|uniref:NlpC/P60 domain-containing protein n=1 Tax=Actinoplanes couchii TaxID=403638 RepID=A0ABQ3XJ46_9ACTN|nr:NlpC/P60 family protein [Actinoplanes couchii]MDR6324486.1 cell wall-associated NlpC family hydrolase [Actinoplanes couchii]GID58514.1 hypothetical protein Aco03nite_069180 [Actinoplanes couchii]
MLTVGALALAVITPALDPVEHDAVLTPMAQPVMPEPAEKVASPLAPEAKPLRQRLREFKFDAGLDPVALSAGLRSRRDTVDRASRAMPRRSLVLRPVSAVAIGGTDLPVTRGAEGADLPASRSVERRAERRETETPQERAERWAERRQERAERRAARDEHRAARQEEQAGRYEERAARYEERAARHAERAARHEARAVRRAERQALREQRRAARSARKSVSVQRRWTSTAGRGENVRSRDMRAVVDFARSQVGKRYVRGGDGSGGFDCSGLTKRAFAKAGISLPHSSGGQARRARSVSRSSARPGDLVVGRGHVGIYMGKGMMVDAGNSRTGVVYRKLYNGLSVSRLS